MGGPMGLLGLYGVGQATDAAAENPEAYAAVQGDRTKQLIAQMLLSQGMQQPQGQMMGRFYVPPSPLQHVGNLAQSGMGALLMGSNDQKRAEMAKAIQDRQKKEVAEFQQSLAPTQGQAPIDATRAELPDTWDIDALQGGPQVGTATLPNEPRAHARMQVPLVDRGGMQPTTQTMPVEVPRSREEVKQAMMQAMMGNNPRLREAAKFMAQQQQAEDLKREDQAIRREGQQQTNDLKKQMTDIQQEQFKMNYEQKARDLDNAIEDRKQRIADTKTNNEERLKLDRERLALERNRLMLDRDKLSREKAPTDAQGAANLYASRAEIADQIISSLEGQYSPLAIDYKNRLGKTWVFGGALEAGANTMMSKESQQADQAQRDFVNAVLRKESGAVINNEEFDNARRQYFPQQGDTPEVLLQKQKNRQTEIAGLRTMSGPLNKGAAKPTAPVKIGSDAEWEKLPSGTIFIGPDGKTRTKP
jgi:hypothetical protein